MKAVFEEINGNLAVFIVEDIQKIYHIPVSNLPEGANVGDIFEASVDEDELILLEKLDKEREKRKQYSKLKREELLNRHKNK